MEIPYANQLQCLSVSSLLGESHLLALDLEDDYLVYFHIVSILNTSVSGVTMSGIITGNSFVAGHLFSKD